MDDREYAGFWIRTGAAIIDTLILMMVIAPVITAIYGTEYWHSEAIVQGPVDFLISYLFPAIAVIIFWTCKSATPGKMALNLTIVDANTGAKPSTGQFIGRYIGYYVAMLPLFMGIIWVGIDKRKQGWHDKLAGTVVIHRKRPEPVKLESQG